MDIVDYFLYVSSIKKNIRQYLQNTYSKQNSISNVNIMLKRDITNYRNKYFLLIKSLRVKIKNLETLIIEIRTVENQVIKMEVEKQVLLYTNKIHV